jgi:hypothetical protein
MAPPVARAAPDLPPGAEAVVNSFIRSRESKGRGSEYKAGRQIVTGDLNGDGTPDLAVLYTLERTRGGYVYDQYLAVFLSVDGKYVYKAHRRVGGRFVRSMDLKSIENGSVLLDTMEYRSEGPGIPPSKTGSTEFRLAQGRLTEVRPQSSK